MLTFRHARVYFVAFALACALAALPLVASAHAALLRSDPTADSAITAAPPRVTLWFSEPIAMQFSGIEVFDAQRRKMDRGEVQGDANDPTRLSVGLDALPNGTYTAAWRNVSNVDGHALVGSFVFYVGERPADATTTAPVEPPALPSPFDPWVRWTVLLAALAVTGGYLFELTVLRPALGSLPGRGTVAIAPEASGAIEKIRRAGIALFLVASVAHIAVQLAVINAQPIWAATPEGIRNLLLGTQWGQLWLVRVGLVLCAVIASRLPFARDRHLVPLLWAGALATFTGSSHAAAASGLGITGVTADYVHLVAAALWVGGLGALLPTVLVIQRAVPQRERRAVLVPLVARFSTVAALGLGTLVITGLFASWLQVGGPAGLTTPYGWAYGAKMAAFVLLAALGAANLLWVRPRLVNPAQSDAAAMRLRLFVTAEVVLGVLVLLATGFMTSMEPARQAAARRDGGGIVFEQTDGGTRIKGRIEPGLAGNNRVRVEVYDRNGRPVSNASSVTVLVKYLDVELGESTLSATLASDGTYAAPTVPLSIGGAWQVQVRVTRPDAGDATAATRFAIGTVANVGATGGADAETARTLWAWGVLVLGMFWLVVTPRLWRTRIARGRARIASTATLLAGVVLVYGAHTHGGPALPTNVNPITPDAQSIAAGRDLYQQNCAQCHGQLGMGDGPLASALNPPPLNLTVHVPLHGDGQLFSFVSGGVPGTAMIPWNTKLSDTQMWNLVNYLRTLAAPPPTQ